MFCPDCGTDNQRNQKFCTRCGASLLALEHARSIVSEIGAGGNTSAVDSSTILKVVALISIFGFLFVTAGGIFLALIESDSPVPFVTIIGGYTAIVLICRRLLSLINPAAQKNDNRRAAPPGYVAPTVAPGTTRRSLGEGAIPYNPVTEETTRQFEGRPRDNS